MPDTTSAHSPAAAGDSTYDRLRSDILGNVIQPAERLKVMDVARRYSVSVTVVREALMRLSAQGLVMLNPKRGFSVAELSIADLEDLTFARVRLETMTLRDSIARGDLGWETGLVAARHAMHRTPYLGENGRPSPEWSRRHRAFHVALISGCGSARLMAITGALRDAADLYRMWSRTLAGQTSRDLRAEHALIVDAALAHDEAAATDALARHIRTTADVLIDHARRMPDDGGDPPGTPRRPPPEGPLDA